MMSCYFIGHSERSRGATVIQFFEDVEFARGDTVKNFVLKKEYFDIPTSIIGID